MSVPKVRNDLLLHRLFDLLNLLQPVHALINLAGIGSDVLGTRTLLNLQQQQIGFLSRHNEGQGKPGVIGMPLSA
ncbi:MAG TPA: hypothetical protein VGU24_21370 [Microvirga sp.]|jgi:hypothetical protein|nr:hypothetical protein [Microvirga sp.]